jgi:hypothetical protein
MTSLALNRPAKFLHVSFNWGAFPKVEELEPVFALALDWVRYAPNCWIVWTTTDAEGWYNRLVRHITTDDRVFICELNMINKQGWMDKWIWEWMNKPKTPFLHPPGR